MKNQRERGEIATILTVGTLVVIAVTAVTSSLFLNQKKTTGSKAAGMLPCNKCVGTVCQKAAGTCNPELDTCTISTDCKTPTAKPTTKAAATPKPTTGGGGGGLKSCGSTPSYTDASTCSTRCGGVTCDPCNNLGKTKYICPNSGSTPTCDNWNDFDLSDCEAKCGAGNCKKCSDAGGNIKYQCKADGDPNDTWTCDMYNNESSCASNNCYWWDGTCNDKEKPKPTSTPKPGGAGECNTSPFRCSNSSQCQDTDEYPNGNSNSYYYGTGSTKGGKQYETSACLKEVTNLREYCCGKEKTPSPGSNETCGKTGVSCSSGTCKDTTKSCQAVEGAPSGVCACLDKPVTPEPSPIFTQNCLVVSCTSQPDYCLDPNKLPIAKDIRKGEKTGKYYGSSDDCIHDRNGKDLSFGSGLCECRDAASCEPRSCGDSGICKNGKQPRDPSKPIHYNTSKGTWHLTQDFCQREEGGAKDPESKCDCETPKTSRTCPNGWRCPEGIGATCNADEKVHNESKCDLWINSLWVAERGCCEKITTTVLDEKEKNKYIDCPESPDQHCYSQSSCPAFSGLTEEVGRPCKPDSLDSEGVCCKKPTTFSSFTSDVTASYTDVPYTEPQGFVAGGGGGTCKAIIVNGVPVACATNL